MTKRIITDLPPFDPFEYRVGALRPHFFDIANGELRIRKTKGLVSFGLEHGGRGVSAKRLGKAHWKVDPDHCERCAQHYEFFRWRVRTEATQRRRAIEAQRARDGYSLSGQPIWAPGLPQKPPAEKAKVLRTSLARRAMEVLRSKPPTAYSSAPTGKITMEQILDMVELVSRVPSTVRVPRPLLDTMDPPRGMTTIDDPFIRHAGEVVVLKARQTGEQAKLDPDTPIWNAKP